MKFSFPSLGIRFKKSKYYNPFLGCPSGYRKQSSYTRKNGKRFPTRCVHASAEKKKATRKVGGGIMSTVRKMTRKCPEGYVYRKAYTRRFHTKTRVKGFSVQRKDGIRYKIYPKQKAATVKASCIREKNTRRRKQITPASAPSTPLINRAECNKLRRGEMFKYNYQYRLPLTARRLAIKKAVADQGPLRVHKKLLLASKCSKGVKPIASKIFGDDAKYISDTYAIGTFVKK